MGLDVKKPSNFLTDHSKTVLLLWILFVICVSCLSVILSYLFLADLWSTAGKQLNHLALLYVMFSCVFVTFNNGVLGQVLYLIVSIPDLCLLPYFVAWEQQRRRPVCASMQSDWHLYYSFSVKKKLFLSYVSCKFPVF